MVGPLLETAYSTGETFYFDKLLVPIDTGNGLRDFYLDYTYSPVFENGKIAGLFGLLQDVTAEVMATRDLRESEARATRVLESIGDAVLVTDVDARVMSMNPVAERLTGWSLTDARAADSMKYFASSTKLRGGPSRVLPRRYAACEPR